MPRIFDGPQLWTPRGPTRRGFIKTACISAAGAVMLDGCARPSRVKPRSTTDLGGARPAGSQLPANTRRVHEHVKRPTCVAVVRPDLAFTSDDDGRLIPWAIRGDKAIRGPEFKAQHKGKAAYVAATPDLALTAGYDGTVILHWSARPTSIFTKHISEKSKPEVWVVTFSADGRVLSGTNDGRILLWGTQDVDKAPVAVFRASHAPVAGLAFVPPTGSGRDLFLSTHSHGDINLWDLQKPDQPPRTFSHHNSHHVNAVAVTSDGKQFVSASFDMTLRLWSLENVPEDKDPKPLAVLRGHKSWIWRVALSRDDSKAASASEDGTVRVWDLRTGRQIGDSFNVGKGGSMGVAFADPETLVFTANRSDDPNPVRVAKIKA